MPEKQRKKGTNLTWEDRQEIERGLRERRTFTEIGLMIGCSPETVSKEIQKHRYHKANDDKRYKPNRCKYRESCRKRNVCGKKGRYKCRIPCRQCPSCNSRCPDFVNLPCQIEKRAPYVCNACTKSKNWLFDKYLYNADYANREYQEKLREARRGIDLTKEELIALDELVSPLVRKGQPVSHIFEEHKAEMGRLADRCTELLEKSDRLSEDTSQSRHPFRRDKSSFRQLYGDLSRKILRTASPKERETEGFLKLQESIEKLDYYEADRDKLKLLGDELDQNLAVQQQEKKGWFLSSENTPEHKRMTSWQQQLSYKLRMLRGEEVGDISPELRQKIRKMSVATLIDNAREATFQYCALKTKNGRDLTFRHDVGKTRYDRALDSVAKLDALADELGTRSPAKRSMDMLRLRALKNRHREEWPEKNAEDCAVRIMYAMTVEFKYLEKEKQARHMQNANATNGARALLDDPAFVRLTENEDDDALVDKLIEGGGKLTDAYIKALNEVNREAGHAQGKAPKDMTREEKTQIWAKQGPV